MQQNSRTYRACEKNAKHSFQHERALGTSSKLTLSTRGCVQVHILSYNNPICSSSDPTVPRGSPSRVKRPGPGYMQWGRRIDCQALYSVYLWQVWEGMGRISFSSLIVGRMHAIDRRTRRRERQRGGRDWLRLQTQTRGS